MTEPLYRNGDRVTWNGQFVCNVASDLFVWSTVAQSSFTNWADGWMPDAGSAMTDIPWLRKAASGRLELCIDGVFR